MNLEAWLAKLHSAAKMDAEPLRRAAERAAGRITSRTGGKVQVFVSATPTGARISGFSYSGPPIPASQLRKLVVAELEQARSEIEADVRARLQP